MDRSHIYEARMLTGRTRLLIGLVGLVFVASLAVAGAVAWRADGPRSPAVTKLHLPTSQRDIERVNMLLDRMDDRGAVSWESLEELINEFPGLAHDERVARCRGTHRERTRMAPVRFTRLLARYGPDRPTSLRDTLRLIIELDSMTSEWPEYVPLATATVRRDLQSRLDGFRWLMEIRSQMHDRWRHRADPDALEESVAEAFELELLIEEVQQNSRSAPWMQEEAREAVDAIENARHAMLARVARIDGEELFRWQMEEARRIEEWDDRLQGQVVDLVDRHPDRHRRYPEPRREPMGEDEARSVDADDWQRKSEELRESYGPETDGLPDPPGITDPIEMPGYLVTRMEDQLVVSRFGETLVEGRPRFDTLEEEH